MRSLSRSRRTCRRATSVCAGRRAHTAERVHGWGNDMPKLTVLMGAPGSGKSTYAKQSGAQVVTTDGARERGQSAGDTLHSAYRQINQALAAGKDVVFDTTGANANVRKAAATIAAKHGAQLSAC